MAGLVTRMASYKAFQIEKLSLTAPGVINKISESF